MRETMSNTENYFEKLSKIDVSKQAEQKGKFTYLSWAWAVSVLRKEEPTATWEIIRFDNLPYLKTELGYFVEVAVTVKGMTLSQLHPVLDNYNKPIIKPNSFQINTSIQRALVKAIALHGLGLYIYAGEDLPEGEIIEAKEEEPRNASGLKPNGDLANNKDMQETLNKKNEEDFAGLKAIIESCASEEELKDVWFKKENLKIINSLKKWKPELYEILINAKDEMKASFIEEGSEEIPFN
jgi:hypothetical protein